MSLIIEEMIHELSRRIRKMGVPVAGEWEERIVRRLADKPKAYQWRYLNDYLPDQILLDPFLKNLRVRFPSRQAQFILGFTGKTVSQSDNSLSVGLFGDNHAVFPVFHPSASTPPSLVILHALGHFMGGEHVEIPSVMNPSEHRIHGFDAANRERIKQKIAALETPQVSVDPA